MEPIFLTAVHQTLGEWQALQLAIDNGMGGLRAKEIEQWMGTTIFEYFRDNKDVEREEVAQYIEEIMDNEFETIVEDGSLEHLASLLCRYYSMCLKGEEEAVAQVLKAKREALEEKRQKQTKAADAVANRLGTLRVGGSGSRLQSQEATIASPGDHCDNTEGRSEPATGMSSDGWTVIERKRNKRK